MGLKKNKCDFRCAVRLIQYILIQKNLIEQIVLMPFIISISQDDRSPISSTIESDDSSDVDDPVPGPESTSLSNSNQNITQDNLKGSGISHLNSINSAIYPTPGISQIPPKILLGWVQSGHLQLHTEEGELQTLSNQNNNRMNSNNKT